MPSTWPYIPGDGFGSAAVMSYILRADVRSMRQPASTPFTTQPLTLMGSSAKDAVANAAENATAIKSFFIVLPLVLRLGVAIWSYASVCAFAYAIYNKVIRTRNLIVVVARQFRPAPIWCTFVTGYCTLCDAKLEGKMKIAMKAMIAGAAIVAVSTQAFAYTLSGTIPGNSRNMTAVHFQKPPSTGGYLKLTLSAPPANVGVGYSVGYCISRASAPASQPCSSPNMAGFVIVPGQQTIVFVNASVYPNYVIWLGTGLRAAVPYTVDVDYVP
jgi:hypothetical protein